MLDTCCQSREGRFEVRVLVGALTPVVQESGHELDVFPGMHEAFPEDVVTMLQEIMHAEFDLALVRDQSFGLEPAEQARLGPNAERLAREQLQRAPEVARPVEVHTRRPPPPEEPVEHDALNFNEAVWPVLCPGEQGLGGVGERQDIRVDAESPLAVVRQANGEAVRERLRKRLASDMPMSFSPPPRGSRT